MRVTIYDYTIFNVESVGALMQSGDQKGDGAAVCDAIAPNEESDDDDPKRKLVRRILLNSEEGFYLLDTGIVGIDSVAAHPGFAG
jgi:hypothetical protein